MGQFLGVDTSNYTTSLAVSDAGKITQNLRTVLKVEEGQRGLRQSDAVFAHTVNLPLLFENLGKNIFSAVGVSAYPRDVAGSYMPCFLAGISSASAISSVNGIPLYRFSHQAGHIAAALYSCEKEALIHGEFLAFHVSGGTTELLHVKNMEISLLGGTKDISAGKVVDRTGVLLGLHFPCGKELEILAGDAVYTVKPAKICVNGFDCNMSGIENKVQKLLLCGADRQYVAAYVISFITAAIDKMTENALSVYSGLPVIYSGGVMSNRYINKTLSDKYGGYFAKPEYSCDNAAGIARLTEMKFTGEI